MARRKNSTKAATAGKGADTAPPARPERAFDVWLDRGLHSMFDSIAAEPIPEEILRLIEEDRKK